MANYFKNSDVNSFKDSDVNAWKSSDFYIKTKVVSFWEDLYDSAFYLVIFEDDAYSISTDLLTVSEEIYGLKLGIFFEDYYGDVPFPLLVSEDYYNDTIFPLQIFTDYYNDQLLPLIFHQDVYGDVPVALNVAYDLYSDAKNLILTSEDLWNIITPLLVTSIDTYSISDTVIKLISEDIYNIEIRNKVMHVSKDYYYLLSETSIMDSPTSSIIIDGEEIDFLSINLTANLDQYCIICEVTLPTENEYIKCSHLSGATCIINSQEFELFVDGRQTNEANSDITYSVSLVSSTVKLDAPYSNTLIQSFPDGIYTQDLINQMAALQGITVDYQILNWFLPSYAISINDETPLEVIKRITQAIGAIIQTKPNGDMLIINKYSISPTEWEISTPSTLFAPDENMSVKNGVLRLTSGYNAYIITSSDSSSANIYLEEEDVGDFTKIIKGFRVPFNDGEFPLATSGGDLVTMEKYKYPIEEIIPVDEKWEIVEFIDWAGSTSNPIYTTTEYPTGIVDFDWIEDDLGAFHILEDGTLTIIDQEAVPSESLLRIKYITKYWKWTVKCNTDKDVQFYVPEEVE